MIQKKVCMLGSFAVGKTSLVRRYVSGIFSDDYLTTVGVKIDRRDVTVDGSEARLLLWDLAGEDPFTRLNQSYLRGSSGYVLVADGTRPHTLEKALEIRSRLSDTLGALPFVLAVNKADLTGEWRVDPDRIESLHRSWDVVFTSARTGHGVEGFFQRLARAMLSGTDGSP